MKRYLKLELAETEEQKIILNPLAISSIEPSDEVDVIKMQNGDVFRTKHKTWNPAVSLNQALKDD